MATDDYGRPVLPKGADFTTKGFRRLIAERDAAVAQRDALREDKRRLANALALMCDQYLKTHGDADEWDDRAMTAGETATELLCEMGCARWDGGRITVPDREALAGLEEA